MPPAKAATLIFKTAAPCPPVENFFRAWENNFLMPALF